MARPALNVLDYATPGTLRDGIGDWTKPIQDALNVLLDPKLNFSPVDPEEFGTVSFPVYDFGALYLPPGIYRITRPIFIQSLVQDTGKPTKTFVPCAVELIGDAPGAERRAGPGDTHASIILADFDDAPAIIIQAGRGVRLRNLTVLGRNDWIKGNDRRAAIDPSDMRVHFDDGTYHLDAARRDSPGYDNPYSPYAAICIDPFGIVPMMGDEYPRLREYYGHAANGSTQLRIEGCHIRGFVAGIVITPSLAPNAENILIADTTIESTVSAIAICQSQSRHMVLSNVTVFGAKFAIDCGGYGVANGNTPSVFGGKVSGVRYLLRGALPGSAYSIKGLLAQQFLAIGQLDGRPNFDGYVFDGCHFRFGAVPTGRPALDAHLLNYTQTVFNGCTFEPEQSLPDDPTLTDRDPIKFFNAYGTLSFRGCRFHTFSERADIPFWVTDYPFARADRANRYSTGLVSYRDCILTTPTRTMPFSDIFGSQPDRTPAGALFQTTRRRSLIIDPGPFGTNVGGPLGPGLPLRTEPSLRWVSGVLPRIRLGEGQVDALAGSRPRFTYTAENLPDEIIDALEKAVTNLGGMLRPDDLLLSETFVDEVKILRAGVAEDRTALIVMGQYESATAMKLGDRHWKIVITFNRPPLALKPGSYDLYVSYFPRVHQGTRGDVADGRNVITRVQCETTSPLAEWQVGDRIQGIDYGALSPEPVLAPGTYVTGVGADTLTISTIALKSATGARLFDADVREIKIA